MLDITALDVRYGDLQALWGVDLKVGSGRIAALIGANGAGKSTTLKAVCGLLPLAGGRIMLEGRRLDREPAHGRVELGVCLVPEGRRVFPEMTVRENLEMGAYAAPARPRRRESLARVLDLFPLLGERSGQLAGTLSGGQQQMLAIGRALMGRPRLLLLDEMSLGLAPLIVDSLAESLLAVNRDQGLTMLLVEQNVHLALELADHGYVLKNGRIVGAGPAGELRQSEEIKQAYLGFS